MTPRHRPMPSAGAFDRRTATRTIECALVEAERRSHALWTTEPGVHPTIRHRLLEDLSAVDAEISSMSLLALDDDPGRTRAIEARLDAVFDRLDRLERSWRPVAA